MRGLAGEAAPSFPCPPGELLKESEEGLCAVFALDSAFQKVGNTAWFSEWPVPAHVKISVGTATEGPALPKAPDKMASGSLHAQDSQQDGVRCQDPACLLQALEPTLVLQKCLHLYN